MENDHDFRCRVLRQKFACIKAGSDTAAVHFLTIECAKTEELDRIGRLYELKRKEVAPDPFGDAVKAAQDLPEPSSGYVPDRFASDPNFNIDEAWQAIMDAGR